MKIVAFLQLYNELEKGNLIRCLDNCKQWADDIVIYDDCSTDGSQDVYRKYTDHIIQGTSRDFDSEIVHKKQLLELALSLNPDWITWIDGDTVFDKECTEGKLREYAKIGDEQDIDGFMFHNVNLWRDECFCRTDNKFDTLDPCAFWKNNGNLHYIPKKGLHQRQYPLGVNKIVKTKNQLLHYGFSSYDKIVNKYLTYKSYGQKGWELDRLIDEMSSFQLAKLPKEWYPKELVPIDYDFILPPLPITYNEIRNFNSWEEYKNEN